MTNTFTLILAAGSSTRFGSPKMTTKMADRPLITLTLAPFLSLDHHRIILVLPQEEERAQSIKEALAPFPSLTYVVGGASRQESVRNAISYLDAAPQDTILIHDGARPLVSQALIHRVLSALHNQPSFEAVVPLCDSVDTLYRMGEKVSPRLEAREEIKSVQTPQAFRFQALKERLFATSSSSSDEGSLFLGSPTLGFVQGDATNIKITTPCDYERVAPFLSHRTSYKSSSGYDVHRLIPGDGVILGGFSIPCPYALLGHSDADVLLHSLSDAIYGLTASGDIGVHFPPSDPQWKGKESSVFLRHALSTLTLKGGLLSHIDLTLMAETPKIAPHTEAIRASLSTLCHLPLSSISLKATTTEGLGFVGRKEGIACLAHVSASFFSPLPS